MKKIKLSELKGTEEYDYIKHLEERIKDAEWVINKFKETGKHFPSGFTSDGKPQTCVDVAKKQLQTLPKTLKQYKETLNTKKKRDEV